ncbi:tetratricopeptide repeat protein [Scrofimicrobium sp. R131]|uniref:Tetratricopeptide repeat protein n=1 Tax=Scrofimicrobium appendicitidis TaxID=3079930 RepID=A0AAU7V9J3_9ACTO
MGTDPTENKAAILEFLAYAPPEVKAWAQRQVEILEGTGPDAVPPTADEVVEAELAPVGSPDLELSAPDSTNPDSAHSEPDVEDGIEDEPEDFYNDMEGEDDLLHRRPKAAVPAAVRPASSHRFPAAAKFALGLVLVVGVGFGVWFGGRPSGTEEQLPTMGASQGVTEEEAAARATELEALIAASPDDVDARLELGVIYFNQAKVNEASEQWLAVTELDPENITAWYNLGFAYLSDPDQADRAQEAWQKVIDIDPDSDLAQTISMHMDSVID